MINRLKNLFPLALPLLGVALFSACGNDNDDGPGVISGESVLINEFMAKNRFTLKDDVGIAHDWVEIINPTDTAISLDGWSFTSDIAFPQMAEIASGHTIEPLGRMVFFLEGPEVITATSDKHLPIVLGRTGGTIALIDASQNVVNELNYGEQAGEFSASRTPDGSDTWQVVWDVTPGEANIDGAGKNAPDNATETVPGIDDASGNFYGKDIIKEVSLDLSEASLSSLRATPRGWVEGSLTIDDRTFEPIGVRLKGNNSFRTIDEKPSFRIELDTFVTGGELFGLDDLVFNNMIDDPTLMRERIAYKIARDNGVAAPRSSYVFITLNGTPYGLYSNIERVERRMISRHFADDTGSLFKAADVDMQLNSFQSDDGSTLIRDYTFYDPKGGPEEFGTLQSLSQALAPALPVEDTTPDAVLLTALTNADQYVDMDDFRKFWAVLGVLAQFDSFPYSYDDYYLYQDPSDMKFHFAPWGMDEAINSAVADMSNPSVARWPLAGEPALTDICQNYDPCRIELLDEMCRVMSAVEDSDLLTDFDAVRERISDFATREADKSYMTYTVTQIQNAQTALRDFLSNRRTSFEWSINSIGDHLLEPGEQPAQPFNCPP